MAKLLLLLQLLLAFVVTVFGIHGNSFQYPTGCSLPDCIYTANWTKGPDGLIVVVNAKQPTPGQTWTGIGFTKEKNTKRMDVVYCGSSKLISGHGIWENGKKVVTLQTPSMANSQLHGRLVMRFTHPFNRELDERDFSFTDSDCYYLCFFVNNGKMTDDGSISIKASKKIFSVKPMCVKDLETEEHFPTPPGDGVDVKLEGEVRYPENCKEQSCINIFKWKLDLFGQVSHYHLVAKQDQNTYTGFGFAHDKRTGPINAYLAFKDSSGKTVVKIVQFLSGSLTPKPFDDPTVRILKAQLDYKDGRWILDVDIGLNSEGRDSDHSKGPCLYVALFPGGGKVKKDKPEKLLKEPQRFEIFNPGTFPGFPGITLPGVGPIDKCESEGDGKRFPIPGKENCRQFIECTDHVSETQTCTGNLYFNTKTLGCTRVALLTPGRKKECGL